MLDRILSFAVRNRWFVLMGVAALAAAGVYSFQRLPIDAVPDITNVQVQINTEAPGFSPLEVEQRITFPVETAMAGLPQLEHTRSISRYGLSQVTVVFHDGTDIYFARQLINERIQEIKGKLPPGIEPAMGPVATGLGEIFLWTVESEPGALKSDGSPYTSTDLRTIQDWIVRPQLRNVPGVADVNTVGGYEKQFHVTPDPAKLISYGLTFQDILGALAKNNSNVGAGYIEHSGEQYLIRAPGQVRDLEEIRQIVIGNRDGVPIYIRDVADVLLGKELRTGAATENGREVVLGTVFMLMGENSRTVSQQVAEKMREVNRTLPKGVVAKTVYDRTNLVNATIATVRDNLLEGAVLVVVILFLFLGNVRAAILTALIIPLSMLFTVTGMVANKVSGNLLSLGALDFGIIVDGAVIIVENCIRRLGAEQHRLGRLLSRDERFKVVFSSSSEVLRPSIFGTVIIMVVYLPILTLSGIEGKMFHPMAFTVLLALLGAMILSVTFIPAAITLFVTGRVAEKENFLMRGIKKVYTPLLAVALKARVVVVAGAVALIALSGWVALHMGSEFLPSLDEGDLLVHGLRIPGTSLTQAIDMQNVLEKRIKEFPEVDYVFAKIGTAEIATDPMPPSVADIYVMMKHRSKWPDPKRSKADLVRHIEEGLRRVPGNNYEFIQPIQMRFNELIAGVRSDVAVKVFGDDMDQLDETGKRIEALLEKIPGASDVKLEQTTGLPILTIQMDRRQMARYGLNVSEVQEVIEIAIGGKSVGEVFEGDRRFELIVRLPERLRGNIEQMKRIPLLLPNGASVAGEGRIRLAERDANRQHLAGKGIDHRADDDRAEERSNAGKIQKVDVAGRLRSELAAMGARQATNVCRRPLAAQDALNAGSRSLNSEPSQNPGDPPGSPSGPFAFESQNNLVDQLRQAIDRWSSLNQMGDAGNDFLFPVEHGLNRKDEGARCRLDRKPVTGLMPKDSKPLPRQIMRAAPGIEAQEPGTRQLNLGSQLFNQLAKRVHFSGQRAVASDPGAPPVMGESAPSGDQKQCVNHEGRIPAPRRILWGRFCRPRRGGIYAEGVARPTPRRAEGRRAEVTVPGASWSPLSGCRG